MSTPVGQTLYAQVPHCFPQSMWKGKLKDMKSELVIIGIFPLHADMATHQCYETLRDLNIKWEKREEKEEAEKNKDKEMQITEKWKPHQQTIRFFEETKNMWISLKAHLYFQLIWEPLQSTTMLYMFHKIQAIINDYVDAKGLVNAREHNTSMLISFLFLR